MARVVNIKAGNYYSWSQLSEASHQFLFDMLDLGMSIAEFHERFGLGVEAFDDDEALRDYLNFRLDLIYEEADEAQKAFESR